MYVNHIGQIDYHRRVVTGSNQGVGAVRTSELSSARPIAPLGASEWLRRFVAKGGWFVPVGELLDHLRAGRTSDAIGRHELAAMERRWLWYKVRSGTG